MVYFKELLSADEVDKIADNLDKGVGCDVNMKEYIIIFTSDMWL